MERRILIDSNLATGAKVSSKSTPNGPKKLLRRMIELHP
jgi:hypothetical protein